MADDLKTKALDQWSLEDVKTATAAGLPTTYAVARTMLEDHDYLQGGKLWVGQRAEAGLSQEQMRRIKDVFVPDPLLEEIRENRTNGLLQREATVAFEPRQAQPESAANSEEQNTRVTKVLAGIATWWDKKGFQAKLRDAFGRTCYSRRAALRAHVPSANLTGTTPEGFVVVDAEGRRAKTWQTVDSLEDALDLIEVAAPPPDIAGRFTLDSQQQVAVVLTGEDSDRTAELWSVETDAAGTKRTVVRLMNARRFGDTVSAKPAQLKVPYDLGGRLPVVEMKTSELVTDPIIKNQSLLNFANTVLNRVLETAGFPERYLGNVEPPGIWLPYAPDGERPLDTFTEGGATFYKHRRPWTFGFSTVAELVGLKTMEPTPSGGERETYATPFVQRFDPVNPEYVRVGKKEIRDSIYKNCRQGHYATDSTAEASGVAYQQHRAQFEADLLTLKGLLEALIRDTIEVVLAYAGLMHADTKAFLEEFRCVVTLHVTSGPVTPAEAQEVRANRDAGLISRATAMGRVGVEDIGAEQGAMAEDPAANADQWLKIAQAITALTLIDGMTSAGAAALLHLSEEEIAIFRTGDAPAQPSGAPTLTAA